MKEKADILYRKWRSDYRFKTMLTASFSSCITVLFAIWNGYLGLSKFSIWHGSICVYYLLLSVVRMLLLLWEKSKTTTVPVKSIYRLTNIMLIVMNLLLIVPIALMTQNQKPVTVGLAIAIAIAAYTTYKVSLAIFHLVRSSRQEHLLVRELRVISFIDAIVAVMSLQTTLITCVGGSATNRMIYFSAWTNAGMFLLILTITIWSFYRGMR